jgi:transcription elongation factor GreA
MAKQQAIMLTNEGLQNYEKELEHLKTVERKEIAEKIKVARSFGDLSENSEYDEAKNEQAMIEARIAEIEAILKNAQIIDESELTNEHIHIGSKVKVHDFDFDDDIEYQIIGSGEADPFNGKLSDESPVGSALIGHKVGDVVEVNTPDGTVKFEILEISK